MTINEIISLSDEDIRHMSKKQVTSVLDEAYKHASTRRKRALEVFEKEPNLPVPKVYSLTENGGFKSWRYVDFTVHSEKHINSLKKDLSMIIKFLSNKTSRVEDWKDVLRNFAKQLIGEVKLKDGSGRTRRADLRDIKSNDMWVKIWQVISRLEEAHIINDSFKPSTVYKIAYDMLRETPNLTIDDLYNRIRSLEDKMYIEREARERERYSEYESDDFGKQGL